MVAETFGWDWLNDPYTQGTWNIFRPGQLTKYHDALAARHPDPERGKVFFAGDYLGHPQYI